MTLVRISLIVAVSALSTVASRSLATEAVNPFSPPNAAPVPNGYVVLSDAARIEGHITATPGLLLRIYDRAGKVHVDIPFAEVARIDVEVEKEWLDREWRWKEAGSTEKVYTDVYYYNHKYVCTLTLTDGTSIRGDLNVVLYLANAAGKRKLFIRKFRTGEQGPKDAAPEIVYVRSVILNEPKEETEE